MMVTRPETLD
jgi:hypothetical protein